MYLDIIVLKKSHKSCRKTINKWNSIRYNNYKDSGIEYVLRVIPDERRQ